MMLTATYVGALPNTPDFDHLYVAKQHKLLLGPVHPIQQFRSIVTYEIGEPGTWSWELDDSVFYNVDKSSGTLWPKKTWAIKLDDVISLLKGVEC